MEAEEILKKFNKWADERIAALEDMPTQYSEMWQSIKRLRTETLQWAKINLERIIKEEKDGRV